MWTTVAAWALDVAKGIVEDLVKDEVKGAIEKVRRPRRTTPDHMDESRAACIAAGLEGFARELPGIDGEVRIKGDLESLRDFFLSEDALTLLAPLSDFRPDRIDEAKLVAALCSSPAAPDDVHPDDPMLFDAWDGFLDAYEFARAGLQNGQVQRFVRQRPEGRGRQTDWTAFLEAQRDDSAFIDIVGISSKRGRTLEAGRYPIQDLYTPLRVREVGLREGPGRFVEDRGAPALSRVFNDSERLLIEGEPGAGKTTFLRLVTNALSRDRLGEAPPQGTKSWRAALLGLDGAAAPLPIYLRLGNLAPLLDEQDPRREVKEHERWVLDLLDHLSTRNGWTISRSAWERELHKGRAVLLFDGLDEVADPSLRRRLFDVFRAALGAWPKCRVVVTTRPIDTTPVETLGFAKATVAELSTNDIRRFLAGWVAGLYGQELGHMDPASSEYRSKLEGAICTRPEIRRIAHNPVMLTCLCVIHWNERKELPEGRTRVYEAVLQWLLTAREDLRKKEGEGYSTRLAWQALMDIALNMMGPAGAKRSAIDLIDAARLVAPRLGRALKIEGREEQVQAAERWIETECLISGIVVRTGVAQVRFWHLTFQEFLAARRLSELGGADVGDDCWWPVVGAKLHDPQWRETVELFPGCLLEKGETQVDTLLARVLATRGDDPDLATDARVAGLLWRLIGPLRVLDYVVPADIEAAWERSLGIAEAIFTVEGAAQVPLPDRIAVAEALGHGDRRFASVERTANLRRIPGLDVALGVYPVTVREYEAFVKGGGYQHDRWWEKEHWAVRQKEGWTAPDEWEKQVEHPTVPVTGVSWYEAMAYCKWRSEMTDMGLQLPSVVEWERAATNEAGPYPWGGSNEEEPDPHQHANYRRSGVERPSPVGLFPRGAGPAGHQDLAGNVWEWCLETVGSDVEVPDRAGPYRALRGGCRWDVADWLRSAYRGGNFAVRRLGNVGFRVALSPASRWLP